ncbi:MAG: hypothetical protein ABI628_10360 [Chloroflexota bacterium]
MTITAADERSPAVSPDGFRVAVKLWPADVDGPQTLAVVDLRTGATQELVREGFINQPSWSPDGQRILFGWERTGAGDVQLWWVPADGSGQPVRLLEGEDNSFGGQWSPDGQSLVCASDRDGFGLYVANADGTDIHKIVDAPRYADAAWSPDSRQIAFTSDEGGAFGLSVVDRDGGNQRLVREFAGAILIPDWSPDGMTLVFESHQSGDGEIGSVSIDGTDERNLTRSPGINDGMGGPTVARDGSIIYASAVPQLAAFSPVIRERLGLAALVTQSVLLALGAALLLARPRLRFGVIAVFGGVAAAIQLGWWGAWAFLPAAIGAALAADVVRWAMRMRAGSRVRDAAVLATLTGLSAVGYLATVASTTVIEWPADWWSGESWDASGIGFPLQTVIAAMLLSTGIGAIIGLVTAGSRSTASGQATQP